MEHFRTLPTEKRFKNLSYDQKEALFYNFLNSSSDDAIRKNYWNKYKNISSGESAASTLPKDLLKKWNYSEDDIKKIEETLRSM